MPYAIIPAWFWYKKSSGAAINARKILDVAYAVVLAKGKPTTVENVEVAALLST